MRSAIEWSHFLRIFLPTECSLSSFEKLGVHSIFNTKLSAKMWDFYHCVSNKGSILCYCDKYVLHFAKQH